MATMQPILHLEYGKRYLTKFGVISDPLVPCRDLTFPFLDPLTGHSFREDGRYCDSWDNPKSLVSEYLKEDETITNEADPSFPEEVPSRETWIQERYVALCKVIADDPTKMCRALLEEIEYASTLYLIATEEKE